MNKKPLGIIVVALLVIIGGGFFVWKSQTKVASQQASLNAIQVGTQFACQMHIGPNGLPLPGTPSIRVVSPNGGESYGAGQQITVKWNKCFLPTTAQVVIQLQPSSQIQSQWMLTHNWTTYNVLTTNTGTATFILPPASDFIPGGFMYGLNYKIKVSGTANPPSSPLANDVSDNSFTIAGPGQCTAKITAVKNPAYGNQTVSQGSTNVKIGSYLVTNNCTNGDPVIFLGTLYELNIKNNGANDPYYKIRNVRGLVNGVEVYAQPYQSAGNSYNLYVPYTSIIIPAGTTIPVDLYGDFTDPGSRVVQMVNVGSGGNNQYNQQVNLTPTTSIAGQVITVQ